MKPALINALMVGAGGFIGALARYGLSGLVHRGVGAGFAWGTLVVNMVGCLAIGVVMGLVESRQMFGPQTRVFLLMGVLGAFTTFSTFGYETFAMLDDKQYARVAANVGVHVVLGLALVWLGYALTTSR